jgi:hypothetical protein
LLIAKHLFDQLSIVAKPVDNEDLISYIVGGLNPIFTPFITFLNFATQDQPISFNAFQAELLNYEQLLEAQNKPQLSDITQLAFFTPKHKPTNKKPRFPTQKSHHQPRSILIQSSLPLTPNHNPLEFPNNFMGGMIEMIIWKVLWFGRVRLRSCYNI